MKTQHHNAQRTVTQWKALIAEARALGCDDAADGLEVHVRFGEEILAQAVPMISAFDDLNSEFQAANKVLELASQAFNDGRGSRAAFTAAQDAVRDLETRTKDARTEITILLGKIETCPALAAYTRSAALIENIVCCCLAGFEQEDGASRRDVGDAEAAAWDPVTMARALKEYPSRSARGVSPDAEDIEVLIDCFQYRKTTRDYAIRIAPRVQAQVST